MKHGIEKTYGSAVKGIFFAVNPLKKRIMKTNCTVHKFIIIQAIEILKINGYSKEYDFFRKYVRALNIGVTWADQDFKSSNHFYHITRGRGLYGFSDALTECKKYYSKSMQFLKSGEIPYTTLFRSRRNSKGIVLLWSILPPCPGCYSAAACE